MSMEFWDPGAVTGPPINLGDFGSQVPVEAPRIDPYEPLPRMIVELDEMEAVPFTYDGEGTVTHPLWVRYSDVRDMLWRYLDEQMQNSPKATVNGNISEHEIRSKVLKEVADGLSEHRLKAESLDVDPGDYFNALEDIANILSQMSESPSPR